MSSRPERKSTSAAAASRGLTWAGRAAWACAEDEESTSTAPSARRAARGAHETSPLVERVTREVISCAPLSHKPPRGQSAGSRGRVFLSRIPERAVLVLAAGKFIEFPGRPRRHLPAGAPMNKQRQQEM